MRLCSLSSPIGEDYPIYASPPETSFGCDGYIEVQSFFENHVWVDVYCPVLQGYYADPEAECQAFHICANFGDANLVKYSFLCPNGTLFNQQYFICDWWFNVDCSQVLQKKEEKIARNWLRLTTAVQAEDLYGLNEEVAAAAAAATAAAAGFDKRISKKRFHRRSPRR